MRCPFCDFTESKVIDSRPTDDYKRIKRRRECIGCGRRFITYETIETLPLYVVKKDGAIEPFSRSKILSGLLRACEKRPITIDQLEDLVSFIESRFQAMMKNEVTSDEIGEVVMEELKGIDEVAYVRFASVYRQFKDVNMFMDELKKLLERQ